MDYLNEYAVPYHYYSSNFIFLFCRVEGNSPTVLLSRKVSLEHEGPPVEFCFRETGSSPLIVYGTAYGGIVGKLFFYHFPSFFLLFSSFFSFKRLSSFFDCKLDLHHLSFMDQLMVEL